MKTFTIDDVMDWKPCYSREEILKRTNGREKYDIEYVIDHFEFSTADKLWLLQRSEFISEKQLHLLACDFAEHALHIYEDQYPGDNRPRNAIETKRAWVTGEATDKELAAAGKAAARATARAAASAAARVAARVASAASVAARAASAAAWATASAAARVAASSAAWAAWAASAASAAEKEWQLRTVCKALKEIEDD